MAVQDIFLRLSSAQQVTSDGASTNSVTGNDISPHIKIGTGTPVGVSVHITAVGTNSGSAQIQAVKATNTGLTSSRVVLAEIAWVTADIAAGNSFFVPIPPGTGNDEFFGLFYDITGTVDFTVDAFITSQDAFQEATSYLSGYTVT